ncbi:MAG: YkgJ family cysteine cluster protein [Methanocalculus sp.]|uniref:YkgJ family cysteine cluster protein n=1 Tax=Methanocalculus sp. TaxID=2004547 RepID=UPI00271D880F|nr:YkgJ family cysteine cluster protein [Methanocalculus sp.]MDO8841022.1 YkgJ family cysteine cluster protein [Methanocalculus sp.]MDO9538400.1 YkgJ family cysteine cluster protein [Methanocalculus sp.]
MDSEFACTLCGRCCNGFGRYIKINQMIGGAYGCSLTLTKEAFMAVPDPGRSLLLSDKSYFLEHPDACPFLRKDGEDTICTIYQSRPRFCRDYICCTGKVMKNGVVCGEMKGRRDLRTDDQTLKDRWAELADMFGGLGDPAWRQEVSERLCGDGYEVIFYG